MSAIRLITDEIDVYYASLDKKELIQQPSYIIPTPKGRFVILGFFKHLHEKQSERNLPEIVKEAIKNDIGVLYLCDKLPNDYIIDEHIIYAVAQWRWFIHTLFFNPLVFKACFGNTHTQKHCLAFSVFTKYQIPIIKKLEDIKDLKETVESSTKNILLEITGGV